MTIASCLGKRCQVPGRGCFICGSIRIKRFSSVFRCRWSLTGPAWHVIGREPRINSKQDAGSTCDNLDRNWNVHARAKTDLSLVAAATLELEGGMGWLGW
jgi:hypothetical protein